MLGDAGLPADLSKEHRIMAAALPRRAIIADGRVVTGATAAKAIEAFDGP